MCCGNCCCFRWSKTMSIVGMALSVIEFILAAVYNFHTFGFCLAIVGMLASAVKSCKLEQHGLSTDSRR